MPASSRFLFLHIPKTAGTSFRLGAIQTFGREHCHFDYGARSPETSEIVRQHVYEQPDLFRLGQALGRATSRFFAGHFGYLRYSPLFRADHVLAFCRDPRQQLMSHYLHFVRHNGYEGDLAQFLGSNFGGGMQTRVFHGLPLEAFGFIGVTERYDECLRVLREDYGLSIESMVHNMNPDRIGDESYSIPSEFASIYDEAVCRDMAVYEQANIMLDARLAALDAGHAYVHGAIQATSRAYVRGFAFLARSNKSVGVELEVNGRAISSQRAVGNRATLRGAGVPRNAYVGFDFSRLHLQGGDRVSIKVRSSGQVLGNYVVDEAQGGESR